MEAEAASEVNTAAEKEAEGKAEGAMDVAEVVVNSAVVVVDIGMKTKMRTVSSPRLETNPSQGEEAAEVASGAIVVIATANAPTVVASGEDKEVSTAETAATDVAATAPRPRELLSQLSNNSNHNNE